MGKKTKNKKKLIKNTSSQAAPTPTISLSSSTYLKIPDGVDVDAERDAFVEAPVMDPQLPPLTADEEADLPDLTEEPPTNLPSQTSGIDQLAELVEAYGNMIVETNTCIACEEKLEKGHFSRSQWMNGQKDHEQYPYSPRCRQCTKEERFNKAGSWVGTPKPPFQILWERGFINWKQSIGLPPESVYPGWRYGKIIMTLKDAELILNNFEIAGHYGFGGLDEGLCCMPGCTSEENLKTCSRCKAAQYCCEDHQRCHYRLHKHQCIALGEKIQ
jgi:hypothetical protein